MKIDRRAFIGGSAALVTGSLVAPALSAKPVAVVPFKETRGGRSSSVDSKATLGLAENMINLQFSDLDEQTLVKAKHRILDLIGCAIGGVKASGNAGMVDVFRESGGAPEASILGYPGKKISASKAAMANAIIARSYDFEVMTVVVGDRVVGSHNSATTSMVALALAQKEGTSGKDFVTALVAGDDMAARILASSGFSYADGWDGSGVYSTIAASAMASRLIGSNVEQTMDAMGIALNTISGTVQSDWDGVNTWKFAQGQAAQNAITSAQLAKSGFSGVGDALLAPYGFYAQFTRGCERPELLSDDLGETFYAEEYFKPYPSCAATHSSHECALALKEKNGLNAKDIDKITLQIPAYALKSALTQPFSFSENRDPHCAANFSIPYQVANAFVRGETKQEHYTDEAMQAPEIVALVSNMSFEGMPGGSRGVQLQITTKDGQKIVEKHTGTPSRNPTLKPSSHDEIIEKFRQQVAFSEHVSERQGEKIIERVANIENEKSMADFIELFA